MSAISQSEARQAQRFARQPVGRFTAKGEQDRRYIPAASAPPDRSLQQRREALAKGNEHRTKRARLKEDISAGRKSIHDVLLDPVPDWAATMKIADLLRSVPGVGRVKVDKTLRALTISHSKTLAGLSARQRSELAGRMDADERRREQRRVAA